MNMDIVLAAMALVMLLCGCHVGHAIRTVESDMKRSVHEFLDSWSTVCQPNILFDVEYVNGNDINGMDAMFIEDWTVVIISEGDVRLLGVRMYANTVGPASTIPFGASTTNTLTVLPRRPLMIHRSSRASVRPYASVALVVIVLRPSATSMLTPVKP